MNKQEDLDKNTISGVDADDILTVGKAIKIEDGKHMGKITNIIRNLPNPDEGRNFDYLDIVIEITDTDDEIELKAGFPTNISELSTLGRVLLKSGMEFKEDDEIKVSDIKNNLIGKKVTFLTKNQKNEAGTFARILRNTIEFA